jgi:hypothetical protein
VAISGATGKDYTLALDDTAGNISVTVWAKNLLDSVTSDAIRQVEKARLGGTVTISGTPIVGSTLTASAGSLVSVPAGVIFGDTTYQWKRNGVAISGATGKDYTLAPDDTAGNISVTVWAKNLLDSVTSDAVRQVEKARLVGTVKVEGTLTVGKTLTAVTVQLASAPAGVAFGDTLYQWKRDGVAIPNALGKFYTLTHEDMDDEISVTVWATNLLDSVTSIPISIEDKATLIGKVAILGVDTVGETLTANTDSLSTDPEGVPLGHIFYRWKRNGNPIADATDKTYRLVQADTAGNITVTVWSENLLDSVTSDAVKFVEKATLRGEVAIQGRAVDGLTLTAITDNLVSDPSGVIFGDMLYRWYRNGVAIEGGNGKTYRLVQADTGAHITVAVWATNLLGYVTSNPTDVVLDTSYCTDGTSDMDCPDYPGFHDPGNGGDTSYCDNGIMNVDCPDYPGYDSIANDDMTLTVVYNDTSFWIDTDMTGKWLSVNTHVATVNASGRVRVTGVGVTYILCYNPPEDGSAYSKVLMRVRVEVRPKPLGIDSAFVLTEKPYDGTNTIAFVSPGRLIGRVARDNEKVFVKAEATYDNPDIGSGKTITVSYQLSGDRAYCYEAPRNTVRHDGKIVGTDSVVPCMVWGTVVKQVGEGVDTTYIPWGLTGINYTITSANGKSTPMREVLTDENGVYHIAKLSMDDMVWLIPHPKHSYDRVPISKQVTVKSVVENADTIFYRMEALAITDITFINVSGATAEEDTLQRWEREHINSVNDTIFYNVPCGVTNLRVCYGTSSTGISGELIDVSSAEAEAVYEFSDNAFEIDVSRYGIKIVTIRLKSESKELQKRYTFVLKKNFDLFDIVNEHLGSVRIVHNNPNYNVHGLTFKSCEWYRKRERDTAWSKTPESRRFYLSAGPSIYTKFSPRDSMYLVLYTTDNQRVETCPGASDGGIKSAAGSIGSPESWTFDMAIYPNPVSPGGIVKLKRGSLAIGEDDDILNARYFLIDAQGRVVRTGSSSILFDGLAMPTTPGLYHLIVDSADGRRRTAKIAVGGKTF